MSQRPALRFSSQGNHPGQIGCAGEPGKCSTKVADCVWFVGAKA